MNKKLYKYEGEVYSFENCICRFWSGQTYASSESKARSNLAYQFKKANNYLPTMKITLPGKIEEVI